MDAGLKAALAAAGTATNLAEMLDISRQAVLAWKRIPASRVVQIERVTKVPRQKLRPDLYRAM
jgi:DNA-binding transcriptional regulator YdaS (Cro superfamily)